MNPIPERVSSRPGHAMPGATSMAAHPKNRLRDCVSSRRGNPHGSMNVSWTDPLHSPFTKRYIFPLKARSVCNLAGNVKNHERFVATAHHASRVTRRQIPQRSPLALTLTLNVFNTAPDLRAEPITIVNVLPAPLPAACKTSSQFTRAPHKESLVF